MNKLWTDDGWQHYLYWQETDKKTLRKINSLLKDIERGYAAGEPLLNGIGDPELLKENLKGLISRTINQKDRLIYKIQDGMLIVYSCYGHYDDK